MAVGRDRERIYLVQILHDKFIQKNYLCGETLTKSNVILAIEKSKIRGVYIN